MMPLVRETLCEIYVQSSLTARESVRANDERLDTRDVFLWSDPPEVLHGEASSAKASRRAPVAKMPVKFALALRQKTVRLTY